MSDEQVLADDGEGGQKVLGRLLEDEMRESFLDYSMSVIVQRALPDVRDGLKPVHRRILYAMSEAGLSPGRAYRKSATVVGDVLGKYHPHGDLAVYDSMVRMAQDFSLRYPLVDGQGNFGSVDGDRAAAYRYTEARLTHLAMELLADIDKETVELHARTSTAASRSRRCSLRGCPNLLINGVVGHRGRHGHEHPAAQPPRGRRGHVQALVDDPDLPQEELESIVTGPDFPTGGYHVRDGGHQGRIQDRSGPHGDACPRLIEPVDAALRARIIVTEIPFMVNKSRLIEQIAQLVRDKKLTEIRDMRDESDRDGMRIVIELKRDAVPEIVLNRLYKHTQMQSTFGTILLALVDGSRRSCRSGTCSRTSSLTGTR